MPEATVNEHSQPAACENDVGTHPQASSLKTEILSKAQSLLVQSRPDTYLRPGISLSIATHH
jgi:hypothetical protein